MNRDIHFPRENFVYLFAICASILLSLWISSHQVIINPDAICYISSAEIIGKSGLQAAMQLCGQAKWPIYSILIYGLAHVSHFSYPIAAYTLNGFFSLISIVLFILVVKELGGSQRVLWLAALTILLSYGFNDVREYIIRDHGFWAFYLLSLFLLLNYFRRPNWVTALFWNMSIILATLFRLEGAIFLFLLPFLSFMVFSYSLFERLKSFFKLNLCNIIICFILVNWLLLHPQHTVDDFGRLNEIFNQIQRGFLIIAERFATTKIALAQHVLTGDSAKEAGFVLFIVMLVWYVLSVMANLSWIYSFLVIYAWWQHAVKFSSSASLVLSAYLGINLLTTLSFLFERLFLSKRYLIALSLVLMLWVPFAFENLLRKTMKANDHFLAYLCALLIIISSVGGIFDFGYSKAYIYEAGKWLSNHIPETATLYSNDYQVMYYSKHFGNAIFQKVNTDTDIHVISDGKWKKYEYLALRINVKHKNETLGIRQEIKQLPMKVFSNKRGDRVEIYHLQ